MASAILVNTNSGNGLLLDGTKPLSEPVLTHHELIISGSHLTTILQEAFKITIHKMSLKLQKIITMYYMGQWVKSGLL